MYQFEGFQILRFKTLPENMTLFFTVTPSVKNPIGGQPLKVHYFQMQHIKLKVFKIYALEHNKESIL